MEFERKKIKLEKSVSPVSIKDNNINNLYLFDNTFKSRKKVNDGFQLVTKIKRNFK